MVYTFAFLSAPPPRQKPRGLQDTAIEYIVVGDLAAAVESGISLDALQQSDERLLEAAVRHDQVICHLCQDQTVLPLRFGTVFISESRLREHLSQNQQAYQLRLQELQGAGEYLLKGRIEWPEPERGSASGRAYLLAKKQQYETQQQRAQQQQQECETLVQTLAQQFSLELGRVQAEELLRLHVLLREEQRQSLKTVLEQWQRDYPHWRLELGGPLPPYHFTHLSGAGVDA
ncbi:GvpL/GvpF family gas vesicle protein [Leptolyngbya sp. FACHB-261]|uniref:GvpL/GvpF family gas vesicle protein n=1 Tax=Leptolyngbya sp. FACHB-261 TaxID=2692806 RepID=UPI001683CBF7|nr:GvpL/GvpF family gas vesicle protein [Leptolyngbya sp. FACHB-261]MBD2104430.1 GvpL/GvpF family gas vesicle protein [Leptolyngbya sp. FACHB-261]